jgi:aryl-alcohol dehydrogenase-like predicted oxidoreductase
VSVQNRYNIADRESDEVLEACEESGLAFFPWAPLGSRGDRNLASPGGPLDHAARAHGASPGQVALAWLLHRSPVMLPIPGTSSIAHFEENLEAVELELDQEELDALEL